MFGRHLTTIGEADVERSMIPTEGVRLSPDGPATASSIFWAAIGWLNREERSGRPGQGDILGSRIRRDAEIDSGGNGGTRLQRDTC